MKTVDKYRKLIKSGRFTEVELKYFRKLINGSSRLDAITKNDLVQEFEWQANEHNGIRLSKEQQQKGIEWLRKVTYKLNGELRKTQVLGRIERCIIDEFKYFRCVGLYNLSDNNYDQYVPIYRCIARDGSYFDYICKMWGEIEVIGINNGGFTSYKNQPDFERARQGVRVVA